MAQSASSRTMSDQSSDIHTDKGTLDRSPTGSSGSSVPGSVTGPAGGPVTGSTGARPSDCIASDPRPSCEVAAMPSEESPSGSSMGSGGISGGSGTGLQPEEGRSLSPRGPDLNPSAGSGG
jgi:hypothetical protein